MDISRLLLVILTCILMDRNCKTFALETVYVDNFCNSTKTSSPTEHEIELTMPEESSGILKAVRAGIYRSDLNCKIIFTPKMEGGIIMSIRMIDFRLNCHDNLTIDDVDGRHTYCNSTFDEMEETSHYSSGSLTIHYQTGKYDGIYLHSGFELIYTAYSVPLCTHEEFECPRGCIWRNLKCDGHNHCGDRSDQKDCPATRYPKAAKPMEVGKIVAIACSCLLILLASVTAIIFVRKRKPKPTADIVLQQRCRGEPYGARFPAPGMYPESLCPQPGEMYYPPPQYSPSDGKQGGKNDTR